MPHLVICFCAHSITTIELPFAKKLLREPGKMPLYSPLTTPCFLFMYNSLSSTVGLLLPSMGVPAWIWFFRISKGQTNQKPTVAEMEEARNCPSLVSKAWG